MRVVTCFHFVLGGFSGSSNFSRSNSSSSQHGHYGLNPPYGPSPFVSRGTPPAPSQSGTSGQSGVQGTGMVFVCFLYLEVSKFIYHFYLLLAYFRSSSILEPMRRADF